MGSTQHVLGIGDETRKCELGRNVDHGFETIALVFQGLQ